MALPRFVPPAGTVLQLRDLAGWWRGALRPDAEMERLEEALRRRYGTKHLFFVSTGRAGMTVLLRVLAEASGGRNELVTPGYTCYSVAASAVRAGLKVRPVDVDPRTLDYLPSALTQLDFDRVVCLASANLYGIPANLPGLEALARERGVAFVDDAAQCLDGRVGDRWVGTFGDAGLFSFDRGKNVTTLQGGVVVCRSPELADRLQHAFRNFPAPQAIPAMADVVKLHLYALLLHPRLYWIPNGLLPLGQTPFDTDYPTTQYSPLLAPVGTSLLRRIETITADRVARGEELARKLTGSPGLTVPGNPGAQAVYPRFPAVFDDERTRDRTLAALRARGFGASGSYPLALMDVPGLAPHLAPGLDDTPGARRVASGILTLPTHSYVTQQDLQTMIEIVRGSGDQRRGASGPRGGRETTVIPGGSDQVLVP